MKPTQTLALATGLALALAACGDNDAEEADVAAVETEPVAATEEFDPMTRDYELTGEAQTRRAGFDVDTFQSEYRGYRDEIAGSGESPSGSTPEAEATATGGTGQATTGSTGTGMPDRRSMSWSYLDRNSDGRLSVAEYAIWAIPLDPNAPKPNDQTKPYVTAEQANKAADSFFYYDTDGDSYLSQREFTTARRGDTVS